MFFTSKSTEEFKEFWLLYFKMTTKLNDYEIGDDFTNDFTDILEEQFLHDLYNESFSNFGRFEDSATLQDRNNAWSKSIHHRGPIPNNVFDYSLTETLHLLPKAVDSEY